jgi:hypothetical protein
VAITELHNSPAKRTPGTPLECPPGEGGDACASGLKPQKIEMRYTGKDCSNSSHQQQAGKVICSGDPQFAQPVRILASDDDGSPVYFDGQVALNGTFTIDATVVGARTLTTDTRMRIFSLQGQLLQSVEFHTSCSQPLDENDRFGSLEVVDLTLVPK